jgi:hypothetical protein
MTIRACALIMKRRFEQWWWTIPSISRTNHLKPHNIRYNKWLVSKTLLYCMHYSIPWVHLSPFHPGLQPSLHTPSFGEQVWCLQWSLHENCCFPVYGKCQESCKRSYIISETACVGCVGELHTCTQLVRNVVEFSM